MGYLFEKIFKLIRAKITIGGLEVSDLFLRFVIFENGRWRVVSSRLNPGIIEGGRIKNREELVKSLKDLKTQIFGKTNHKNLVNVIFCPSSTGVYSQVFSLPIIAGEDLDKAIELNLQTFSPDVSENYSSWQIVSDDKASGRFEVLAAFMNRAVLDEMNRSLRESGFLPVVVEFKALALSRLIKEGSNGFDAKKSYLVINIDQDGLDFLVIRRGQVYFEYLNLWENIRAGERYIPIKVFETVVQSNFNRVVNFCSQHWPDGLSEIIVLGGGLNQELIAIIKNIMDLPVRELTLKIKDSIMPDSYVALGSGFRSLVYRSKDKEINFLGPEAQEEFRDNRLLSFFSFWRVLMPASLVFLVMAFGAGDLFLIRNKAALESQPAFQIDENRLKEIEVLRDQVAKFNRSVYLISLAKGKVLSRTSFLENINELSRASGTTINRLTFRSDSTPVVIEGEASSLDRIREFKDALDKNERFFDVNLPLDKIQTISGGKISFSMSLRINIENAD